MRIRRIFCLLICLTILTVGGVSAQGKKTIVLVRHAERDGAMAAGGDAELSAEGRERAIRLMLAIKKYKPHEIYSTSYKRTRQTAEPIASRRKVTVQTYDPTKQNELVDKIMLSKTERFFVVGHSNTVPVLANLLLKKEVFRNLLETEHGVFWVIRMKKGAVTRVEVFPY